MSCKILKFNETNDSIKRKLIALQEKERKMGKNPYLKEWFEIRNTITTLKRKIK